MKPKTPVFRLTLIAAALISVSLILISWDFQGEAFHFTDKEYSDTVPPKKAKAGSEKKVRDLDEAIEELENAELKVDMEKIRKEI